MENLEIFDKDGKALNIGDVINLIFKDPIDICFIPEVYDQMLKYRNEHSTNQQKQLAVSCETIKKIVLNSIKGL
jgi:hypothetical protein